MPIIDLNVKGKVASVPISQRIVKNNSDYQVKLHLDSQWSSQGIITLRLVTDTGVSQTKITTTDTVTLDPIETGEYAFIGVFAGTLATTTPARIRTPHSIKTLAGSPEPPSQSVYDQIIAMLNGFSASVSKVGNVATISITDPQGTTTAQILDGAAGAAGNGIQSIIFARAETDGNVYTVTMTNGTTAEIKAPKGPGGGTTVEANPTMAGTEDDLTGLKVGETKYKVPSGNTFIVHITSEEVDDETTYSSDRTAAEIYAASAAGKIVEATMTDEYGVETRYKLNGAQPRNEEYENGAYAWFGKIQTSWYSPGGHTTGLIYSDTIDIYDDFEDAELTYVDYYEKNPLEGIQKEYDTDLNTTSKTVAGAINELRSERITRQELAYVDKRFRWVNDRMSGKQFTVDTEEKTVYEDTVQAGAKCAAVQNIGGKTVIWNQLAPVTGPFSENGLTVTKNASETAYIINGTATATTAIHLWYDEDWGELKGGNTYAYRIKQVSGSYTGDVKMSVIGMIKELGPWRTIALLETVCIGNNGWLYVENGSTCNNLAISAQICNITRMFGAGNEPTASAFGAMFPADVYAYDAGSLLSADISSVDSENSGGTELGEYAIPQALRAAYPLRSAGNVHDEYDIERKKFVQRVGSVDLGSLTWTYASGKFYATVSGLKTNSILVSDANLLCKKYTTGKCIVLSTSVDDKVVSIWYTLDRILITDSAYTDVVTFKTAMSGVNLYYELANPAETDISSYLTEDNLITVSAGGKVRFTQSDDIRLPVPSKIAYAVELASV